MTKAMKSVVSLGLATLMIALSISFTGSVSAATKVAATKIKKIDYNKKKQTVKVTWKKVKKATGYQLQFSTDKRFKTKTVYAIKKASKVSKKIKYLSPYTTYYVRVRTYKTVKVNGKKKNVFSKFTAKKKFTAVAYYKPGQGLNGKTVDVSTLTSKITGYKYTLKYFDDFNGTQLDAANWKFSDANSNGSEVQAFVEENLVVENGNCIMYARKDDKVHVNKFGRSTYYTGTKIDSYDLRSFKYGRVEMYAKLPLGANGTWPAFWTLGYGSWPEAGEIDIMEMTTADYFYACTIHSCEPGFAEPWTHDNATSVGGASLGLNDKFNYAYHLIGMEWTPTEIHMYCDGNSIGSVKTTSSLTKTAFNSFEHYMIINFALGGMGGSVLGPDGWVDAMYIDWVKIWQSDEVPGSVCYQGTHHGG